MAINPYQAPTATTVDAQPVTAHDDLTGQIAALPAGAGASWIGQGFELFKASPGAWVGIAATFFVMSMGVNLLPFIGGFIWSVLMPLFIGGLMLGCDAVRRGEGMMFQHLFEGFNRNAGQLALVGAIYIGFAFGVVILLGIGAAITIPMLGLDFGQFLGAEEVTSQFSIFVLLLVLVMLAVSLPLVMAVWFAPALVVLHDMPALEAMKQSFMGCLRNIVPFLVYGVVSLLLAFVATIPLALGWLVLGPVLIGSAYAGYRGIYCAA